MSSVRAAARLRAVRLGCPRCFSSATSGPKDAQWPQRTPLGAYYESILIRPSPYPAKKPEVPPSSANDVEPAVKRRGPKKKPGRKPQNETSAASIAPAASPIASPPVPTPPPTSAEEAARRVFGSRLYGDEERAQHAATKKAQSSYVAGIFIPPKPEEPDNCCMSGCVNCVWDRYREDFEEWTAAKKDAEERLAKAEADEPVSQVPSKVVGDAKIAKDLWDDSAFQGVPVGIREFMKLEKQLKKRHDEDGTLGG